MHFIYIVVIYGKYMWTKLDKACSHNWECAAGLLSGRKQNLSSHTTTSWRETAARALIQYEDAVLQIPEFPLWI